jgi:hypothetical protein
MALTPWRLFHLVVAVLVVGWVWASTTLYAAEADKQAASSITTDEILTKVIDAYGGKEALAKVVTTYTRAYSRLYNTDNDGWVTRYVRHPLMLRVDFGYHSMPDTRILNNRKGWMHVGTVARKDADKPVYEALVFQYNYMRLPFELAGMGKNVVYKGKEKVGRAPVDVLLVKGMNGMDLTLYIDETTHLVAKASGFVGAGAGKREVSVELLDYKVVDNIKVPFKMINSVGSIKVSETLVNKVVFNQEMADSLFQP